MERSWASKQVESLSHTKLILDMAEQDYQARLKQYNQRTGTQTASERPAKPPIVGSNPTPCSKDQINE